MPIDAETARARLGALRDDLQALSGMSAGDRDAVELDQQSVGRVSRMDALQQQAMAQATERQRHAMLARIAAAFARLDAGDYGFCDACGEEIPEKRLEIDPTATHCVRCASGGGN